MNALESLRLILLTAIGLGVLASILGSLGVGVVLGWVRTWAPASRRWALVLAGVTPLLSAVVAFGASILPVVWSYVKPGADRCMHHDDARAHLCFIHWPSQVSDLLGWSIVAGVLVWMMLRLVVALTALHRTYRLLLALRTQASLDADGRTWTVPVERPFGITLGLIRPWILLSAGLRAMVSPDALTVIVAHEEAHVRAHDALLQLLVRFASFLLWPSVRHQLGEELLLATEQAADEQAAQAVGDRVRVAEAILTVERLKVSTTELPLLSVSFAPQHVARRVESLLEEPLPANPVVPMGALLLVVSALVLSASDPIHHLAESVLGLLLS